MTAADLGKKLLAEVEEVDLDEVSERWHNIANTRLTTTII